MNRRLIVIGFFVGLLGAVLAPAAKADVGHEAMIITVKDTPVEVPGHLLMPGKYQFKFVDLEHHVLDVSTANGNRQIGFFDMVPIWHPYRAEHTKLDLSRASSGSVPRIRDFFYREEKTGYKFLYSQAPGIDKSTYPR